MRLAKIRHRIMATLLDLCIVCSFVLVVTLGKLPFTLSMLNSGEHVVTNKFILDTFRWGTIFGLGLVLYYTIIPVLLGGQTIGKKVFKLQIVKDNGEKVDYKTLFVREGIGMIFIHFASLGITVIATYIVMLCREDKKSLADILAKTKVVDLYESEE